MKKIIVLLIFIFNSINLNAQQCSLLDAGDDITVTCTDNCATLTANFMPGFSIPSDPNHYTINASTPCPLPPLTTGQPTSITVDDEWSEVITLPFEFKFFGVNYTQIIVGDNGVVSFDINRTSPKVQVANEFCDWNSSGSFGQTPMRPLPDPNWFRNTIYGAYHDLYIPDGGSIDYYVSGDAPQRIFVINFNNVAQYGCSSLHTTQRILLYETTNVIDVQILRKDVCTSWNGGGLAVVGIQNEDGTIAYSPPGRNIGVWQVSQEELWRFSPNNPADPTYPHDTKWYDVSDNSLVGTGDQINVCVTENKTYRCEVSFTLPNGDIHTLNDTVNVIFDDSHDNVDLGQDFGFCENESFTLDATVAEATAYQWQYNGVDIPGETNPTLTASEPGEYSVNIEIGVCSTSDSVIATTIEIPIVDVGPDFHECEHNTATLTTVVGNAVGDETYQWQKDGMDIPGATAPTLDVTETGVYTVNVTNNHGCIGSDEITVTFDEYPELELGADQIVCAYDDAVIQSNINDADVYTWTVNGQITGNHTDTLVLNTPGEYDVLLELDRGKCSVSDFMHVTILDPLIINPIPIIYGELKVEAQGGLPPYQFSIDNNEFNKTGYFYNLPDGDYSIFVKDANNCFYEFAPIHITNLIFPEFFTPNGDGYNDYWRVENSENTPNAQLQIFDRFGKLIKTMNPYEYWDGTYNGKPLIASDYWYILSLPNGKIYKGHFAIKR